MRLHKLTLKNFRGFENLELDFDPASARPVVLVGVNGAGKSSILDAVAMMLLCLTEGIRSGSPESGDLLSENDIRVGAANCVVALSAKFPGYESPVSWTVATTRAGYPASAGNEFAMLRSVIGMVQDTIKEGHPELPLAVHYPTNRSALDILARIRTPHEFDALSAYEGALQGSASDFRGFFEWFREEEDIYNEQLALSKTMDQVAAERPALGHVRGAIEAFFPGSKGFANRTAAPKDDAGTQRCATGYYAAI